MTDFRKTKSIQNLDKSETLDGQEGPILPLTIHPDLGPKRKQSTLTPEKQEDMVQLETQGKYDPWGKPGGGAPITKEDHKLRRLNPQAIISPNQAGGVPIFVDQLGKPGGGNPISKEDHKLRRINPDINPDKSPTGNIIGGAAGGDPTFLDQLGRPGNGAPLRSDSGQPRRVAQKHPDLRATTPANQREHQQQKE